MNILQISSSIRASASESTRVASAIVARLQAANPGASLVQRDLVAQPHPGLDEAALGALFTPATDRSPGQAARVALDDALIAEVQAADVIVIGSPMYNFTISAQLKNWLDAIARAGVTFQYTADGPEGLLKNKKVFVAAARGGMHQDAPTDGQVPYIKTILGFLGMTDVTVVYSEGMSMGPEAAAKGQAEADAQVAALAA